MPPAAVTPIGRCSAWRGRAVRQRSRRSRPSSLEAREDSVCPQCRVHDRERAGGQCVPSREEGWLSTDYRPGRDHAEVVDHPQAFSHGALIGSSSVETGFGMVNESQWWTVRPRPGTRCLRPVRCPGGSRRDPCRRRARRSRRPPVRPRAAPRAPYRRIMHLVAALAELRTHRLVGPQGHAGSLESAARIASRWSGYSWVTITAVVQSRAAAASLKGPARGSMTSTAPS